MKNTLLSLFFLIQVFVVYAGVNFDFDDANGTNLSVAVNDGTSTGSWNFGGPQVQNSALNIGYTPYYKFNNNNSHDLSEVYRTYTLDSALTTGEYTFEVEIDSYDYKRAWDTSASSTDSDKGINFIIKGSDGIGATINLFSHFLIGEIVGKVQSNDWGTGAPDATLATIYGDSDPTVAEYFQFDTDESITLQINANLDTGNWSARFKESASETWLPLTQDGTGLNEISQIQLKISNRPNDPWGDASLTGGTAGDYVRVAGISLTAPEVVTTTDIAVQGSNWGANADENVSGTFTENLIGDSDQIGSNDVTMQIAADLNTGNWSSRYKVGAGNWVSLVTDGTGITDVNRLQLNTKTPEGESWGTDDTDGIASDYIKVSSLRVLNGTAGTEINDFSVDYSSPLIAFEFDDAAGTEFSSGLPVVNSGSITGTFQANHSVGHQTDGDDNLNIGYALNNKWVSNNNSFENSFRTYNLDSPITSADVSGLVILEAVISNYDLSKSWDESSDGSYSGKGVQFSMQNSNNAGAAVNFYTNNKAVPNAALQLDFDDAVGTALQSVEVLGLTGAWNFGGPRTSGDGTLNIGFSEETQWTDIYGSDGNSRRTFELDEAITTGRYIIETRIDSADLTNTWNDPVDLVANKGLQVIAMKEDGSGAVVNLYSHVNNSGGYQVKAQSNIWAGQNSSTGAEEVNSSTLKQAFGLPSSGNIDLQILVNATTGQWTTRAKSASSSDWKNMELGGTGFTDIKSIQINTKTPSNSEGTGLAIWGNLDDESTTEVDETTTIGDYIKIDHIRILNDTGPDTNNDIVVSGKKYGSGEGLDATAVTASTGNFAQSGENLTLKLDADLDTGEFTSSYSIDSGVTWIDLATDGTGLNEVKNINLAVKNGDDDAWGTSDIAGGTTGDYVLIESVKLTDVVNGTDLVALEFDDDTGTNLKNSVNAGSASGSWTNGGPQTQGGVLNIGYTKYYKWTNANYGHLNNVHRKYVLDNAITSGQVSLVVNIREYDLSRSWDNTATYNVNSASGKGIQFALTDSTDLGGLVNLFTESAVEFPDGDGDGIPDHVDEEPNSGGVFEGYYMRYDFNDESGTALTEALNLGVPSSAFTAGGPQTSNGNLNIGYTENWKWAGVDTGNAAVFRTNNLSQEITSGVVVYQMVIDSYDLSKSWDPNSDSAAEKGVRMIIKNGSGGGNPNNAPTAPRQGTAIQLYTTGAGDVQVQAQPWYGSDAVVLSEGTITYELDDTDMADDQGLILQVVIDLDTGAYYSRFSQDDGANWNDLIQFGSGFTTIHGIQIATKRAADDSWGDASIEGGTAGDFVKIDSIHIRNAVTEPTPVPPSDSDGDGVFDYEDAFPSDPNKTLDADGDGVAVEDDPDDADPDNPNPQTPAEAPSLSISTDGSNVTVTWEGGEGFNLHSSSDLSTWSDTTVNSSPHTESVDGAKFFKLTNE